MTASAAKKQEPQNPEQKAANDKTLSVARQTMVGDLRDVCLEILRNPKLSGKAWKDMKEQEQKDVVNKIVARVESSVISAIDVIAAGGRPHIKALMEQVVVKDGIKGVFKCSKHDELRHDLFDAQGSTVLVVLTNSEDFLGEREKVEFDKDQPKLPGTETTAAAETSAPPVKEGDFDEETGEIKTGASLEDDAAQYT